MRIPDSEDETLLAFAEPVGHDRDHARPAGRLKRSPEKLETESFKMIFAIVTNQTNISTGIL